MTSRPWGLVLDADVLLRSSARDLFLHLAALDVVDPLWSEQILEEVARNFPRGSERFQRLHAALEAAFPEARKTDFEHHIPTFSRTSRNDRHVLALAAEYEADLVSFNHRHFDAGEASRYGVIVWTPDAALNQVIQDHPEETRFAVERAYLMLRKPPVQWPDFIEHIRADGMPKIAAWIAGVPEPPRRG
ncbi:MAG: PIN domain-containing protein [Longimicrobiaceae bacterium]